MRLKYRLSRSYNFSGTFLRWSRGQPPHHSKVKVLERSWAFWVIMFPMPSMGWGAKPSCVCILRLSFSLNCLEISQVQVWKAVFMQKSQLTPHLYFFSSYMDICKLLSSVYGIEAQRKIAKIVDQEERITISCFLLCSWSSIVFNMQ